MRPKFRFVIGIDPGTKTGFALWDRQLKKFKEIKTLGILEVAAKIMTYAADQQENPIFVRIEDPHLRKWFGPNSNARKQGAGSIKRDFKILKALLEKEKIPYQAVNPKDIQTKVSADYFGKLTGYTKRTSEHARDAAMMVYRF